MTENIEKDPEYPFRIATPQHRLGGKAVDIAMYVVTFGIGWFIWSLVVWGQGQTPGKQIVKLRVYDKSTSKPVKWGHMAIREVLVPLALTCAVVPLVVIFAIIPIRVVSIFGIILLYLWFFAAQLLDALWIFKGGGRHRLVDVFCKTDVINESLS